MTDPHAALFGGEPETTHKAEQEHGPSVVNGKVRWLSASVLTMADTTSSAGCLRRYYYNKVERRPEPSSLAQEIGTKGHKRIEHYLRTGEKALDQIELAGVHFMPEPDPSLLIEGSIADWGVHVAGIPVVGNVDLVKPGRMYIRDDGEEGWDPEGTVEVLDWKFRGDLVWSVTGPALAETTQMITYGESVAQRFGVPWLRLSHVNFQTRGKRKAKKATVLVRREDLPRRWNRVEGLARNIIRAAACSSPEEVEPNTKACPAYSGCPHQAYCSAGRQAAIDDMFGTPSPASVFGVTTARAIGAAMTGDTRMTQPVNLLNMLNLGAPAAAATLPGAPPPAAPTSPPLLPQVQIPLAGPAAPPPPPPAGPTPEEVAAERARLEAEQAAAKAKAEARKAASAHPGVREAWLAIKTARREDGSMWGAPPLTGEALRVVASAVHNYASAPDEVSPGEGTLGALQPLTSPAQILQLAGEMGIQVPVPVAPPDAPPSDPAKAAMPVEGYSSPEAVAAYADAAEAKKKKPGGKKKAAEKPPEAPAAAPPVQEAQAPAAPVQLPAPPAPAPVSIPAPAAAPVPAAIPAPPPAPEPTAAVQVAHGPAQKIAGLRLFVGAIPSCEFEALDPWIDSLCRKICKEYGLADVRLAPEKHPLAFGKGKAAVAAMARAYPPPAASYVVFSRSEVAQEVVEALRPMCELIVEGVSR